jgi:hypothetical protein
MFHTMIIRLWILMNLTCTLLCVYDNLGDKIVKNRLFPVCMNNIKKLASVCIGCGAVLVLLFTKTVGFFALPLILYLINRTCRNVFDKGF